RRSAPTTTRADSVTVRPWRPWPRTPVTCPSWVRTSWTVKPSRTSAPAWAAASTRSLSSTGRRGGGGPGGGGVGSGEGEGAEVEAVGVDRGAAGRGDLVEQPPAAQRRHPRRVEDVGRDRVAGEARPVEDQDLVALAGEQHRGRRPGTPRPHHDHVVPVPVHAHVRPLLFGRWGGHHGRPAGEHRGGPLSRG